LQKKVPGPPLVVGDIADLVDELGGPLLSGITTAHKPLSRQRRQLLVDVCVSPSITAANLNDVWSWRVDSR